MSREMPQTLPMSRTASINKEKVELEHNETSDALSAEDQSFLDGFTEEQRRTVIRKIDFRLVPMLALLYLISFLDRANIGNANIEGLSEDLGLIGAQYNVALSVFFIPYILLEMPSNVLLLKFKKPSRYIALIVCLWSLAITFTGLVTNFAGLVSLRVLLGVFEAGFFPAAVYLISTWYLPNESQLRIAIFFSASALAGAFSGLLAFAIAELDGLAGYAGWRWIFILEGAASFLIGLLTWFFLVDTPETSSRWLTPNEQRYLRLRQNARQGDGAQVREAERQHKWRIARSVFCDWQIYLQALIYWSVTVPNYGLKFTMPQIIKNMGYASSTAQLLTVPPYMLGAISAFVSSYFSDRFRRRFPFIIAAQSLVIIAFAILFSQAPKEGSNAPQYFALFLANAGFYPITPGANAWTVNNLAGPTKRSQGVALMISIGNIGGLIGSYIYIDSEKPSYPTGFGASFSFCGLGVLAACTLEYFYWRINRQRDTLTEADIRTQYTDDELKLLGDRSPYFRYNL